MAGVSLSAGMNSRMSGAADSSAVAEGKRDTTQFSYQQPGKKATTILSPHLETISYGSMIIVLDNSATSLPLG